MNALVATEGTLANPYRLSDPSDPDAKIDRAGVWSLSMGHYHWQITPEPGLSSSGLRTIWAKSPAHFHLTSPYNADAWEWKTLDEGQPWGVRRRVLKTDKPDAQHYSLGRAAHHLLYLGRKGFEAEYAIRPDRYPDWKTNRAKEWRAEQFRNGKTVLTDNDLDLIAGMARSLAQHPLVRAGILDGYVERSLLWKDEETGLWLKSRPDNIPNDTDVADLKSTSSGLDNESLARTIAEYGYHCQGALVREGFREVLGREMTSFSLVFVESKPPHCVRVITLKDGDLDIGHRQNRAALHLAKDAFERGVWDGPGGSQTDAAYLEIPTWYETRAIARLELMEQGYGS